MPTYTPILHGGTHMITLFTEANQFVVHIWSKACSLSFAFKLGTSQKRLYPTDIQRGVCQNIQKVSTFTEQQYECY